MQEGSVAVKFNFNNGKKSQKQLWLSQDGSEVCWGRSQKNYSKLLIKDCLQLRYGPTSSVL